MATLVMVRTICCESYKTCGKRCDICPHRPENEAALREYQQAVAATPLGSAHAGQPTWVAWRTRITSLANQREGTEPTRILFEINSSENVNTFREPNE